MIQTIFSKKWFVTKPIHYQFFIEVPLYVKTNDDIIVYKPAGKEISIEKIKNFQVPPVLYLREEDLQKAYNEVSKNFYEKIIKNLNENRADKAVELIIEIADEVFKDPKYGSSIPAKSFISAIIKSQFENKNLIKLLLNVTSIDYTTSIHSIHVMALMIRYGRYKNLSQKEIERLSLLGFLHDIGKSEIPFQILNTTRKLSEKEMEIIKKHPIGGAEILRSNNLEDIVVGTLQHHERLDGSGYPFGLTDDKILYDGRLLSIVDSYESMTSDVRLYGEVKTPYESLKELRDLSIKGKYDFDLFSDFVRSFSL